METRNDQNWQLQEETPTPALIEAHLAARRGRSMPAAPAQAQQDDSNGQKFVARNY